MPFPRSMQWNARGNFNRQDILSSDALAICPFYSTMTEIVRLFYRNKNFSIFRWLSRQQPNMLPCSSFELACPPIPRRHFSLISFNCCGRIAFDEPFNISWFHFYPSDFVDAILRQRAPNSRHRTRLNRHLEQY